MAKHRSLCTAILYLSLCMTTVSIPIVSPASGIFASALANDPSIPSPSPPAEEVARRFAFAIEWSPFDKWRSEGAPSPPKENSDGESAEKVPSEPERECEWEPVVDAETRRDADEEREGEWAVAFALHRSSDNARSESTPPGGAGESNVDSSTIFDGSSSAVAL